MRKDLISIGYEIPGKEESYIDFDSQVSLMDADILIISPDSLEPWGDWVSFTTSDGGCYNVQASNRYKDLLLHLKKELEDHLMAGKNVFVFLTREKIETLASGVSSPRKGQNSYSTYSYSNYNFLPVSIGKLTSASGKHIQFSGNSIFGEFYSNFKNYMKYELYTEDTGDAEILFTGKDKSKVLGAVYKFGSGHLITLPVLTFNEKDFTEVKAGESGEEVECWNTEGLAFGNTLEKSVITIDKQIAAAIEATPPPEWVAREEFIGEKERKLRELINKNNERINKIRLKNKELEMELAEEERLKDLLFETGKPLENAVIKALKILGYKAENYDDGDLEMDQVIISPEKNRYIGENEGKDRRDINITKFRQLVDALNADFSRDEVEEKAFGILFGNAERLVEPEKRTLDFTDKCKTGADREKIALVKTSDLFVVAKYLNEHKDKGYMKLCREAIHSGLGRIVKFPEVPGA